MITPTLREIAVFDVNYSWSKYTWLVNAIWLIFKSFLDISLLFAYIHVTLEFNKRIGLTLIPDEIQHEQLLRIARYSVVFTISIIFELLYVISIVGYTYLCRYNICEYYYLFFTFSDLMTLFNILSYMIAAYCYFEWSHYQYEKFCAKCHNIMYKRCEKLHIKRITKDNMINTQQNEINEPLL